MNGESRLGSLSYSLAFLGAVCAAITSAIIASIALLWVVAAAMDGRWQGALALAALSALAAVQVWFFFAAIKHRDAGRIAVGTLYLVISALPALALIWVISL